MQRGRPVRSLLSQSKGGTGWSLNEARSVLVELDLIGPGDEFWTLAQSPGGQTLNVGTQPHSPPQGHTPVSLLCPGYTSLTILTNLRMILGFILPVQIFLKSRIKHSMAYGAFPFRCLVKLFYIICSNVRPSWNLSYCSLLRFYQYQFLLQLLMFKTLM